MCGNRLNDWNTIPMLVRIRFSSTSGAVTSTPPTTIRPAVTGSIRLMQRSSVDLPEPDAPIRQITSCSDTARSMPRSTSALPKLLRTPSISRAAVAHPCPANWRRRSRATSQSVNRASGIVISTNSAAAHRYGREVEVGRLRDVGLAERLHRADDRHQRRVLLQPDEVVQERRDHPPHRLRHDHEPQRLEPREAERAGGSFLARVHRLDACAVDLGDVGRVDEDQRDAAPEQLRRGDAGQLERRHAEAQHDDHQDRRDAAEQVRIDDRHQPEREKHRPREAAKNRDPQREDQDHRLADHEQLHVDPEMARDVREPDLDLVPVEERRLELGPARRVDHDQGDRGEHQDRADQGDRGAAAGAAAEDAGAAVCYCNVGASARSESHFCSSSASSPLLFISFSARSTQVLSGLPFSITRPH